MPFGRPALLLFLSLGTAVLTAGCASDGPVSKVMEVVGLKKPEMPDDLSSVRAEMARRLQPRKVPLRLHAGQVLNTDPAGRPLSVVARIYKLRSVDAFLKAPYEAFAAPSAKPEFEQDVAESREVVLTPGQQHEVIETLAVDSPYLGVVVMFRAPAQGRWRYAFDGKAAGEQGITLGLHACAISVAQGSPLGGAAPEQLRVAGVQCP